MWRPATRAVTGTNDAPLGNKRRFGLPEEAPAPAAPPANYSRPPAQDIQYFNGRVERDRPKEPGAYDEAPPAPAPPAASSRWDEKPVVREERRESRWDERRDDRERDYRRDDRRDERRDDRGYDRERERDRERDRDRDVGRERERRYDERDDRDRSDRVKEEPPAEDAPRKRKSRWGAESQKVELPGLPSQITGNVSQTELDNYAIHVRLEEIGRKLRTGDVIPPPGQRSPSPPPEYDPYGRRTNTLDIRYRKKLEDERLRLIDRAMKADPTFKPPTDVYAGRGGRFGRPSDKVYIPVKEFPEINFFGLLVGPRGNSLKNMERQTGAKISIRGKGSVKEGKQRPGDFPNDEDDELHCLVMADDEAKVRGCVALINRVIETAASTPEGQNDHKRNQLRELASLNGTLRDDENQLCQNCGEKGHRRWECPQQRVYSANVICRLCGGAGHMARDCRGRGDPNMMQNKDTAFDSEYSALMQELGEGGQGQAMPGGAPQAPKQEIPPWRIPENWQNQPPPGGGFRGPPGGGWGQQGGYQQHQQQQNPGYGYGGPGGQGQGPPQGYQQQQQYQQQQPHGQGGYGGPPQGGAADPYASYYAGLGQTA